jgi:hypothetical protein
MGVPGGDGVRRLSPRVSAELLLDAQAGDEPRLLMEYLRGQGFAPDYLRSKSYVAEGPARNVVSILPFGSEDMTSVAALSVQRDLDEEEGDLAGSATIVRLHGAATPIEFTLLQVRDGRVLALGPTAIRSLQERGVAEILGEMLSANNLVGPSRLAKVARGRGIAPVVLSDLADDEVRLGFTSSQERDRIVADGDLYADVARLHSYLSQSRPSKPSTSCKYCTSTSCYACTSCSCGILATNVAIA